ncbi:MAG: hypothetical protein Ct9H300mP28_26910 [Pseudomonadota bacterium]|nr:MAG: hypothetical protein Ct9H300mP28_26910 [Pseudomonadota bacterium]
MATKFTNDSGRYPFFPEVLYRNIPWRLLSFERSGFNIKGGFVRIAGFPSQNSGKAKDVLEMMESTLPAYYMSYFHQIVVDNYRQVICRESITFNYDLIF